MKRNTTLVRKLIRNRITSAVSTEPVFFDHATEPVSFPYVIYGYDELQTEDGRIHAEISINVVDRGTDTAVCEALTDAVADAFDHADTLYGYMDDDGTLHTISISTYVDQRKPVGGDDKTIIRRNLTIEAFIYEE